MAVGGHADQARAPYVCMLHHDDLWLPGRARAVRSALARHPDVACVLHPTRLIDEQGRSCGCWRCPLDPEPSVSAPQGVLERLLVQNFIACPAPTFRRDTALAVGGIDPALWYTGDWDFYLKLLSTGATVYLDEPLAAFRLHGASLTISGSADLDDFRRQLDVVLERHIGRIDDDRRRRLVRRVADASNEVNGALAAALHRRYGSIPRALAALASLGPAGWRRYFRDSRIVERVMSRLRVRGLLLARRERTA